MTEQVTTGAWRVAAGREADFIAAWTAFAEWASARPGATTLRLGRDVVDPTRFVSFAAWEDAESVRAWKGSPEFREALGRVVAHVDDFQAAELDVVATASGGRSSAHVPAARAAEAAE